MRGPPLGGNGARASPELGEVPITPMHCAMLAPVAAESANRARRYSNSLRSGSSSRT